MIEGDRRRQMEPDGPLELIGELDRHDGIHTEAGQVLVDPDGLLSIEQEELCDRLMHKIDEGGESVGRRYPLEPPRHIGLTIERSVRLSALRSAVLRSRNGSRSGSCV